MKKVVYCAFLALSAISFPIINILAEESVIQAPLEQKIYPVVILGGGIGGLTSSLYLARAGIEPLVLEGKIPGGLLTQSHSVQNWPGDLEIEGVKLTDKVKAQAAASGVRFLQEEVTAVDFSKRPFTIWTRSVNAAGGASKEKQIQAEACIIAMGTEPNFLKIPGESGSKGYWGRGISNCAICDGTLYRGSTVGIAGGGDAAILEALYLSNIADKVYVFVRKNAFKATEEKRLEALLTKPNVKIFYDTEVKEVKGNGENLTHVVLKSGKKEPYEFSLDGLFLAIGSKPNTAIFRNALKLDAAGYIQLQKDQQTSVKGVYAIGDIVDPVYKQAISASGDGAKAAMQVQSYLSDRTNALVKNANLQKGLPKESLFHEVIEVSSLEQFERELKMSEVPVIVDFYATWCGPCKQISPILDSSANQLKGKIKFLKVNVDKVLDVSRNYGIRSMPTVLFFNSSGDVIERKVGTDQITDLLNRLQNE